MISCGVWIQRLDGQSTFTYELDVCYSGINLMSYHLSKSGDQLFKPIMQKIQYLVSHMDGDGDLICLDDNFEEIILKVSPQRNDAYRMVTACLKMRNKNKDSDVYVEVL